MVPSWTDITRPWHLTCSSFVFIIITNTLASWHYHILMLIFFCANTKELFALQAGMFFQFNSMNHFNILMKEWKAVQYKFDAGLWNGLGTTCLLTWRKLVTNCRANRREFCIWLANRCWVSSQSLVTHYSLGLSAVTEQVSAVKVFMRVVFSIAIVQMGSRS